MGTQVVRHPDLPERVHVVDHLDVPDAAAIFAACELLVIDGIAWDCDLAAIRSALIPRRRAFKAAFGSEDKQPAAVEKAIAAMWSHADRIYSALYPFVPSNKSKSFRPMITGPEPMHFDTYVAPTSITSFVNVSSEPRIYNIGPSFARLVQGDRDGMAQMVAACKGHLNDFSYVTRKAAMTGHGPLGDRMPRHRVEFAPWSIWFFNPKTVSHEVVYGAGAISFSWEANSAALSQQDLLRQGGLIK